MGKYAFGTPRLNCPHWYVMQWDLTEFDGPVFKGVDLITDGLLGPQIGDCDGWGEWAPRLSASLIAYKAACRSTSSLRRQKASSTLSLI